jgi:HK97 family phage major capsid protein
MGITNASTGPPILQLDVHGNPFISLLGRPIVIAEQAASVAATAVPILFGDLSSYRLRTVRNFSIFRFNEKYEKYPHPKCYVLCIVRSCGWCEYDCIHSALYRQPQDARLIANPNATHRTC